MKKLITLIACFAVLFSLTACVPTARDSISVGPDLSINENVEYDFTQLHNDTIETFEGKAPYSFITDFVLTGSNEDKMVYVKAVCLDDATEEVAACFAAAVLKYVNDAAYIQDVTVGRSDSTSFGTFWNKFGFSFDMYTESEAAKADGVPMYSLKLQPGEASGLDTDVDAYEEEWERQMEIALRNEA